jgi:uncharacterized protein (TIGR02118 family)
MTVKLTVVYGTPEDAEAFDKHYSEVHMPLVQQWPGVQKVELAKVTGGPMGSPSPYHQIAEIWFDDEDALNAALGSEPGRAAGKDFMSIATPGSFMTVSEVVSP